MNIEEARKYVANIDKLEYAYNVVSYDNMIFMPKKALEQRAEVLGYLSSQIFKLRTSDTVKNITKCFVDNDEISEIDKAMIKNLKKNFEEVKNIPEKRYTEFMTAAPLSEAAWEEAKKKVIFQFMNHI